MKSKPRISIFDYTDYRKFLRDYYQLQKSANPAFSYRFFARKAGTSSVGLYKDVVEGRLALGKVLTARFSKALCLTRKESDYFECMVSFNEAVTIEEQRRCFERMLALCQPHDRVVDNDKYEYYSRWYYGAVRTMLLIEPWNGDCVTLATMLEPPIKPEETRKAIEVLERLGFIERGHDGRYRVVDPTVTTGRLTNNTSVQAMQIKHYQRIMCDLGKEALDRFPLDELDMSTLTIAVSEKTMRAIKDEIAGLRQRVKALAERDEKPERIFQLNHQLFPLSKKTASATEKGNA